MNTRTLVAVLALALVGVLGMSGAAQATTETDILAAFNSPRVTAISSSSGVVTADGEGDAAVPGDFVRTHWYTAAAAMAFVQVEGGSSINREVNQSTDPPAEDNFNRANESPIGGNWADADGTGTVWSGLELKSNKVTHYDPDDVSMSYWTPQTFSGNIEVCATTSGGGASGIAWGLALLQQPGATTVDCYRFRVEVSTGGTSYVLQKITNGSTSTLGTPQSGSQGGVLSIRLN
jgi:hypothetical protein